MGIKSGEQGINVTTHLILFHRSSGLGHSNPQSTSLRAVASGRVVIRQAAERCFRETLHSTITAVHVSETSELAAAHSAADGEAGSGLATEVHATRVLVRTQVVPLPQISDITLKPVNNL